MADTIEIEILEDGMVKFSTDKISAVNHASADELLAEIEALLGGKVDIKKKQKHGYGYVHMPNHIHH